MTYLLDTDTLIFLIRGLKAPKRTNSKARQEQHRRAQAILRRCQEQFKAGNVIALSAITVAELEFGARKSSDYRAEMAAVWKVLARFRILHFDGWTCATNYGEVRWSLKNSGQPIGAMALLIAAHSKAEGAVLVTNNSAHFGRVAGLILENWS